MSAGGAYGVLCSPDVDYYCNPLDRNDECRIGAAVHGKLLVIHVSSHFTSVSKFVM